MESWRMERVCPGPRRPPPRGPPGPGRRTAWILTPRGRWPPGPRADSRPSSGPRARGRSRPPAGVGDPSGRLDGRPRRSVALGVMVQLDDLDPVHERGGELAHPHQEHRPDGEVRRHHGVRTGRAPKARPGRGQVVGPSPSSPPPRGPRGRRTRPGVAPGGRATVKSTATSAPAPARAPTSPATSRSAPRHQLGERPPAAVGSTRPPARGRRPGPRPGRPPGPCGPLRRARPHRPWARPTLRPPRSNRATGAPGGPRQQGQPGGQEGHRAEPGEHESPGHRRRLVDEGHPPRAGRHVQPLDEPDRHHGQGPGRPRHRPGWRSPPARLVRLAPAQRARPEARHRVDLAARRAGRDQGDRRPDGAPLAQTGGGAGRREPG